MRIDPDMPVDVLVHSMNIDYIDLNDDELMHWKYIKKKKLPNGKWRYYYDVNQLKDDLGFDERKQYKDLEKRREKASERANDAFRNWMDYYKKYDYKDEYQREHNNYLRIKSSVATDVYRDVEKKFQSAYGKYMNTPLGKLEKASKAVSNFFSNLFGKKK